MLNPQCFGEQLPCGKWKGQLPPQHLLAISTGLLWRALFILLCTTFFWIMVKGACVWNRISVLPPPPKKNENPLLISKRFFSVSPAFKIFKACIFFFPHLELQWCGQLGPHHKNKVIWLLLWPSSLWLWPHSSLGATLCLGPKVVKWNISAELCPQVSTEPALQLWGELLSWCPLSRLSTWKTPNYSSPNRY